MRHLLAIDQGTQSTRAALLDRGGRILSLAASPVRTTHPQPGWVEQDAREIIQSSMGAIDRVLKDIPASLRTSIACCGIATQRSTVLAWDEDGRPLSAAINWQDTRSAALLSRLQGHADEIKRISGLPLSAHYGATKLRWLIDTCGDNRIGPISSYLLSRLTGSDTHVVDQGNAQRMQLLDIHTMDWSDRLSALFEIPVVALPQCRPVSHAYGLLQPYGIPITAMNGDQNAAWFSSGLPSAGTALVNIGSGAFVLTPRQEGTDIPKLLTSIAYSDLTDHDYLLEATVNGAGNALRWLYDNQGIVDQRRVLPQALEQVSEPPIFLNTVGGLGSPWWRSGLDPIFDVDPAGLTQAEMLAAVAESMLFLIYHNIQLIQGSQPITGLQLSGGLSRVDRMCQKLANLSNLSVRRSSDPEHTIRGIAWIAAGRPETWSVPEQDLFLPQKDPGLVLRYNRFLELLRRYIEENNKG